MVKRLWLGEHSLAASFWGFFVLGLIGVSLASDGIAAAGYLLSRPHVWPATGVLAGIVAGGYAIVAGRGVWMSANRHSPGGFWPAAAKFVVCPIVVLLLVSVFAPKQRAFSEARHMLEMVQVGGGQGFDRWMAEYQPLADYGDPDGQMAVGMLYASADSGKQDLVQAYMWLTLSAASGSLQAQRYRDVVAALMAPMQTIDAEIMARTWTPPPLYAQ